MNNISEQDAHRLLRELVMQLYVNSGVKITSASFDWGLILDKDNRPIEFGVKSLKLSSESQPL